MKSAEMDHVYGTAYASLVHKAMDCLNLLQLFSNCQFVKSQCLNMWRLINHDFYCRFLFIEVVENAMYQSAGDMKANTTEEPAHALYAQPLKKKTQPIADSGDIYAVVDKTKKHTEM